LCWVTASTDFSAELAESKLSMILDNLIRERHDCFVTKA
jgi:hypothetical protein